MVFHEQEVGRDTSSSLSINSGLGSIKHVANSCKPVIRINRNYIKATVVLSVALIYFFFFLAFYDEYNLAIAYEKPIFTISRIIAGGFKISSIINSIITLPYKLRNYVARFGFKKVLKFLPVTDHHFY